MIRFADVGFTYDEAPQPTLAGVDLEVPAGELCLVVGPTGAGKSTLLGLVNGHVPHFTGGELTGSVVVDGRDTRDWRPRDLADVVGVVGQDPARGFVTDRVTDELAWTMESLAVPATVMRRRVEDTLDLLGLVELRDRPLDSLSGGQQQRVAIGAALTAHPQVLVLDEPTSALDPAAAEEVLAALQRLVTDLGLTVLLAEHRLERVIGVADSVLLLDPQPGGAGVRRLDPATAMAVSPIVPPVVELGRFAGWDPLPLTIRDARRHAGALLLRALPPDVPDPGAPTLPAAAPTSTATGRAPQSTEPLVRAQGLTAGFDRTIVGVGPIDLAVAPAETVAVMGRNGAGKSTLLWALAGAIAPRAGTVELAGRSPAETAAEHRRRLVTLVPQQPGDLLYRTSVGAELAQADADAGVPGGSTAALLAQLTPAQTEPLPHDAHPRDLSEGQRLRLVLAIQLVPRPRLLLLDEPTRGLDYPGKRRLGETLARLTAQGTGVLLASHDVEFVAATCGRVVILADGRILADGSTAAVVTASPAFAPQVAKVFAPRPLLTVAAVRDAVGVLS